MCRHPAVGQLIIFLVNYAGNVGIMCAALVKLCVSLVTLGNHFQNA